MSCVPYSRPLSMLSAAHPCAFMARSITASVRVKGIRIAVKIKFGFSVHPGKPICRQTPIIDRRSFVGQFQLGSDVHGDFLVCAVFLMRSSLFAHPQGWLLCPTSFFVWCGSAQPLRFTPSLSRTPQPSHEAVGSHASNLSAVSKQRRKDAEAYECLNKCARDMVHASVIDRTECSFLAAC